MAAASTLSRTPSEVDGADGYVAMWHTRCDDEKAHAGVHRASPRTLATGRDGARALPSRGRRRTRIQGQGTTCKSGEAVRSTSYMAPPDPAPRILPCGFAILVPSFFFFSRRATHTRVHAVWSRGPWGRARSRRLRDGADPHWARGQARTGGASDPVRRNDALRPRNLGSHALWRRSRWCELETSAPGGHGHERARRGGHRRRRALWLPARRRRRSIGSHNGRGHGASHCAGCNKAPADVGPSGRSGCRGDHVRRRLWVVVVNRPSRTRNSRGRSGAAVVRARSVPRDGAYGEEVGRDPWRTSAPLGQLGVA